MSYFSTITYNVGNQKNRLNVTGLLSTQNICINYGLENIYNFTLKICVYLNQCILINPLSKRSYVLLILILNNLRCGTHYISHQPDCSDKFFPEPSCSQTLRRVVDEDSERKIEP